MYPKLKDMKLDTYGNNKYLNIQFTTDIQTVITGVLSLNQNENFKISFDSEKQEFKVFYRDDFNETDYNIVISFEFKQTLYDDVSLYTFIMMSDMANDSFQLSDMESFIDFFIDAYIKDMDNKRYYYDNL